jgi:hypothetical protein
MGTAMKGIKVYVPREDCERFEQILRDDGRTVAGVVRKWIREYLAEQDAQNGKKARGR